MAGQPQVFSTDMGSGVALVTTAETVLRTLSGVNTNGSGRKITFFGLVELLTGTATTAVTLRIRRDSLTGTVCQATNPIAVGAAAGSVEEFEIQCDDERDDIAGATYVLTAQQTGATGNGNGQGAITAIVR